MDTYGTWKVSTEGDIEGRTTKELGTFTGHVDEIALHLTDKAYYKLSFERTNNELTPKGKYVNVQIVNEETDINDFKKMGQVFENRPVEIQPSNYYNSFLIVSNDFDPEEEKRLNALNKLTEDEKRLLGLI